MHTEKKRTAMVKQRAACKRRAGGWTQLEKRRGGPDEAVLGDVIDTYISVSGKRSKQLLASHPETNCLCVQFEGGRGGLHFFPYPPPLLPDILGGGKDTDGSFFDVFSRYRTDAFFRSRSAVQPLTSRLPA